MTSLRRTQVINSQHMKCIVRPERVIEMGNDDVIQSDAATNTSRSDSVVQWTRNDTSTIEVNENRALIHHYKKCDTFIQGNCRDMITDDVMLKFKENLQNNHKSVMEYISDHNMDKR